MAKTENHIPKLRFSGFTDPWEMNRLGDICSHFQSGKGITTNDIYENAEYPVYGGNGLRGYAHTFTHEGLFTLIGRQGALCGNINLVSGKNYISEHAVAVQADLNNDTQWLSYVLDLMNLGKLSESSAQPGLAVNKLVRLKVNAPSKIEQTKIGNFFQKIDQVIELQQKALETAQDYKKAMLQKMFPQKGEKVPKVRFDGFDGDWEEKKLGDIGSFKNGLNKNKEDFGFGIPFINLMDVFGKNTITQCQFGLVNATDKEVLDYSLLESDVLFIRSSVKPEGVGLAAVILENLEDTVYSGFLIRFREFSGSLSKKFKCYCFNGYDFRQRLLSVSTSSANTNINQQSLSELLLSYPKIEEQRKIGAFFQKLDEQIEQHEKKLESYQSLKKAMLQRMFV